ncbi:PREDICTED: uncharacterized protein LOC100640255 [Amphimedon queenslandica]|uniref:Tyrosine specific protein phosphatases domain-containing protein n=1 Tax=Amphimedon queenslandica TaxID=400682 RepID=A0A1X7U316_AMPQE|nr:PREDICTED: uncharacterized protein LOC100640255 [Amphimedon queenslandica]|eukprot:XP_003389117.1 PREDICTED: uncharacterized protein LOC100640255 [Amphimedon queenslandica]
MWTMKIIWHIFTQANFIVRWLSLILVLIDWLSGLHLFVKFYTWLVLNHFSVAKQYIDVVELAKPVIIDVIRFMCREDSLPMLIHCAHGKDRTGLLVAVVLGLLEVESEDIIRDYAESQDGLLCIKDRVYQEIVERYGFKLECTYAERETMEEVLEHIEKNYGSMSEYLLSGGFTLKEQEHFKRLFLEPESE